MLKRMIAALAALRTTSPPPVRAEPVNDPRWIFFAYDDGNEWYFDPRSLEVAEENYVRVWVLLNVTPQDRPLPNINSLTRLYAINFKERWLVPLRTIAYAGPMGRGAAVANTQLGENYERTYPEPGTVADDLMVIACNYAGSG